MQDIRCKLSRVEAVVIVFMFFCLGSALAQYKGGDPWQTGDIVACFGHGNPFSPDTGSVCNVLRVVSGNTQLLDQFSDNLGGSTFGVGINNTLHVVVTDDSITNPGTGSDVVVFSVASLNPNTTPPSAIAHTPFYTFDSGGTGSSSAKAIAMDKAGNMYVLNGSVPNIVELGPGPTRSVINTIPLTNCSAQVTSMDLSADASTAYITALDGTIWTAPIPVGGCTKFADFGLNVKLYGIKDIPPNALPANCGSSVTTPAVLCPTHEALLVVATGNTDPDASTGEASEDPDTDSVNICTNTHDTSSNSCALLIDTNSSLSSLTAPLWKANTPYPGVGNVNTILDPQLKLQSVFTAGTSGSEEPAFSETGGTVIDNAVKWTDISPQPVWVANNPYTMTGTQPPSPSMAAVAGTFFVDPNGNLQTVTTAGTSGQIEPTSPSNPTTNPISWSTTSGGTTIDGLQWQFSGTQCIAGCPSAWVQGTQYPVPSSITDSGGFVWNAVTGGTSGATINKPLFESNHNPSTILADNAVVWTESHPLRIKNTAYMLNAIVLDAFTPLPHVQQVSLAGTTGTADPFTGFSDSGGISAVDGLQWQNQTSPAIAVVARYPVGTPTIQSLALDPLIVDCTGGCNYPLPPLQVSSVITSPGSLPTLTAPGFWLGDHQNPNVWKLDFATGTPVEFDANGGCSSPGCTPQGGIQGLGIYGSESANQPGLAKLLFDNSAAPINTQRAFFPSSTANSTYSLNSLALTLYNGSSPAGNLQPFAVYASVVAPNSCFDDSTGNPSCLGSFQPGPPAGAGTVFPLMWKMDVPLPSSGNLALSSTQTLVGNFDFPTNFQSLSNDVKLDSQFDVTTLVGLDSPIYRSPSTSHGSRLKSANGQPENDYKCSYNSPVISPSKNCYANPGTLPIKFSCSNLGRDSLSNYGVTPATPWGPTLQIIEFGPPPVPSPFPPASGGLCDGTANTGSAPSQANANNLSNTAPILAPGGCETAQLPSSNHATTYTFKSSMWTYNWQVQSTSAGVVYQVCTFDDSDGSWDKTAGRKGTPFCTLPFYVKNSCP